MDIQVIHPTLEDYSDMTAVVKNGKGKMKPIAGLTDAQIKDVVTYFRSLKSSHPIEEKFPNPLTIEEMRGSIPDLTGGLSLKEFLEDFD